MFYNARDNYENNKKGLFAYFNRMSSLYLLSDRLEYLKDKEITKIPGVGNHRTALPNSLMSWLRVANSPIINYPKNSVPASAAMSKTVAKFGTVNADTYLGYWDIVRNYYSYSSWGVFSFAHPGSYRPTFFTTSSSSVSSVEYRSQASYFWQRYGNLEFLDHYFETMFYPRDRKVSSDRDSLSWNRSDLFKIGRAHV